MPTTDPIALADRLDALATALVRQSRGPTIGEFNAVDFAADVRFAAREMHRFAADNEDLRAENLRLRGVILDEVARIGQEIQPEPGDDLDGLRKRIAELEAEVDRIDDEFYNFRANL